MLKHGNRQPNLTLALYDLKVPQTHLLRRIAAVVDFSFINEVVADTYHKTLGRPAKEPELMLKLVFLEFLYNLSDEEVVARAETDLAFMWFLGVLPEDHMPDASSLTRFRRDRLGLERTTKVLAEIVEQCRAKGLVGSERVIVDSTDIAADATVLRPAHVQRRAIKKLLKAVAAEEPTLAAELACEVSKFDSSLEEAEQRRQAHAALERVVGKVGEATANGRLTTPTVHQRLGIAQQIAQEGPARIASTTDTEARFGRKGRYGYQQQMAMSEDSEIILGVRVTPGNHADVTELVPLVEAVEENHPGIVEAVTADRGYDSRRNREQLQAKGIEPFIAMREPDGDKNNAHDPFFPPSAFYLDENGRLVCPVGQLSSRTEREPGQPMTRYIFRKRDCQHCPLRSQCTNDSKTGRRIRIYDQTLEERRAHWQAERDHCQEAMTKRRAIEHKQAEEVRFHGLRRARYRGLVYVTIQAILTAIAVNAKRMATLLCPPAPRTC